MLKDDEQKNIYYLSAMEALKARDYQPELRDNEYILNFDRPVVAGTHSFKPCVIEDTYTNTTEMLLEDTLIIWERQSHKLDLGYSVSGDLVGIRVAGLVKENT